jgi:hypothetical protein
MIPFLRRSYNAAFTDEKYQRYHRRLEEEARWPIPFRLAESPVFLPTELVDEMVSASLEIWRQLSRPEALKRSEAAVPARFNVPGSGAHPVFAVTDFAVVRAPDGRLAPKLIELQGFPSLYAFQLFQTLALRDMCPEPASLDFLFGGLDSEGYRRVVGDAILAGLPPENVVLLDLDPPSQKTSVDFAFTEKLWDVRAVCATKLEKRGKELWYDRDGKPTRILRIYNRLIFDELAHKGIELPIDFREELDVAWAGHPNWYFRWSKHALPALDHPTVPEAHFLSDLAAPPEDLSNWVLKPLFSFAGSGVKVDVTPSDIAAIPPEERSNTLLMRKVDYASALETTDGSFSRSRSHHVRLEGRRAPARRPSRLSQGKMMGVAFNKDRTWVGSSGCLWPSLRLREGSAPHGAPADGSAKGPRPSV